MLSSINDIILSNYEDHQFVFRPKSSTQCALVYLHDQVTKYLGDPTTLGVRIVTYDYSKAFDRLRFDLLIHRMLGFPPAVIKGFADYFRNRTQVVRVGEGESGVAEVTSCVPQGS